MNRDGYKFFAASRDPQELERSGPSFISLRSYLTRVLYGERFGLKNLGREGDWMRNLISKYQEIRSFFSLA